MSDIYILINKNLNPFSIEGKVADQNKHEMIYMLWKECMSVEFYKFICQKEVFLYLMVIGIDIDNGIDMVWLFISQNEDNYIF